MVFRGTCGWSERMARACACWRQLGADDGTLSWSPDGSQVFVYGGTGSFLVDAATGEVTALGYVAGYGSTGWLPD
jgi:hypothetical protein